MLIDHSRGLEVPDDGVFQSGGDVVRQFGVQVVGLQESLLQQTPLDHFRAQLLQRLHTYRE